jgi:hypothetical protein
LPSHSGTASLPHARPAKSSKSAARRTAIGLSAQDTR